MQSVNVKRSQAILRMPIDMVDAEILLHDGDRAEVLLFMAPTDDIAHQLTEGPTFLPIVRGGVESLVARTAIAGLGVPKSRAPQLDEDLLVTGQKATVKLRSGQELEGELRWIGSQKLAEHLNADTPFLVVVVDDTAWILVKTHIAAVTEA
jgi:hypothetical protein